VKKLPKRGHAVVKKPIVKASAVEQLNALICQYYFSF